MDIFHYFQGDFELEFKEPNPTTGRDARKHEHDSSVNEMNSPYRDLLWRHWFQEWYGCTVPHQNQAAVAPST